MCGSKAPPERGVRGLLNDSVFVDAGALDITSVRGACHLALPHAVIGFVFGYD